MSIIRGLMSGLGEGLMAQGVASHKAELERDLMRERAAIEEQAKKNLAEFTLRKQEEERLRTADDMKGRATNIALDRKYGQAERIYGQADDLSAEQRLDSVLAVREMRDADRGIIRPEVADFQRAALDSGRFDELSKIKNAEPQTVTTPAGSVTHDKEGNPIFDNSQTKERIEMAKIQAARERELLRGAMKGQGKDGKTVDIDKIQKNTFDQIKEFPLTNPITGKTGKDEDPGMLGLKTSAYTEVRAKREKLGDPTSVSQAEEEIGPLLRMYDQIVTKDALAAAEKAVAENKKVPEDYAARLRDQALTLPEFKKWLKAEKEGAQASAEFAGDFEREASRAGMARTASRSAIIATQQAKKQEDEQRMRGIMPSRPASMNPKQFP